MTTENNVAAQAGDEPMRADFEAWARAECGMDDEALAVSNLNRYFWGRTADMWAAWKGAQVSPRATADVELEKKTNTLRTWLSYALRQSECDMVLTGEECRRISAVLATTKPGA